MAAAMMVDRKIIVFSLNADDGGQSPRGRFPIFHYEFISPTPFFALCWVNCLHKQCGRLSGFRGVLFHQERARRAATCAQELISVMDVYLARACS